MRKTLMGVVFLVVTSPAFGQSISPVVSESVASKSGRAGGVIIIQNSGIVPLVVTLEPHSFGEQQNGKRELLPVDVILNLKFSQTSAKIPPMSSWESSWSIENCQFGCGFAIFAMTAPAPVQKMGASQSSASIHSVFGSEVFVYKHGPLNQSDFSADLSADGRILTIGNAGDDLGRPLIYGWFGGHRQMLGGYFLFKQSKRTITLPMPADRIELWFVGINATDHPRFKITATKEAAQTAQK